MTKRARRFLVSLGVMGGVLLLGPGLVFAQGPAAEALMRRDAGPPVPDHLRAMSPGQFGGVQPLRLPQLIETILRQRARRQVVPLAPHRDLLEFGPEFHRDPSRIPQPRPQVVEPGCPEGEELC